MWGCVFAMYQDKLWGICQRIITKSSLFMWLPFLAIPALSAFTLINHQYDMHLGWFIVPFGNTTGTIADIAIGFIIIICIHYSSTVVFKMLNTKPLDYLGRLSYSLYIWQQLFFSQNIGRTGSLPLNIVLLFIVANISYYGIEKPFMRMRQRLLPNG
jgi:peptidoglycan/LPS O-acetylase OafA/YrhL